jgi:hypothetical protein
MTLEKTRALLQDQLVGGGLRAQLWQSVIDPRTLTEFPSLPVPSGTLRCSCVVLPGQHADRRCNSCNGIGWIPGYMKFGYETIWCSSINSSLVLNNLALNISIKPNRLELVDPALTGTAETSDLFFIKTIPTAIWESRSDYTCTDGVNSAVVTEFSTDGGYTWNDVLNIASINPSSGRIRFRVTISRNSTDIVSPAWEIVRVRFPVIPIQGRFGPWILVLKTVQSNRNIQDMRGIVLDAQPNNFWTCPLSFYTCTIPDQCAVGGKLDQRNLLVDPCFIQFLDGIPALLHSERWSCTNLSYSDPFGYLVRQAFQARMDQINEHTALVF